MTMAANIKAKESGVKFGYLTCDNCQSPVKVPLSKIDYYRKKADGVLCKHCLMALEQVRKMNGGL